jgi:hypothetical protein
MVGSYSGSPSRKIVSAAVALKPVKSVRCSRLQLLRRFPKRAYLIQVALFKFRSDCSTSSAARLLAVLMSCILGSLLLLFFRFHSDSSLYIPSGNFRTMDLLVNFCIRCVVLGCVVVCVSVLGRTVPVGIVKC